MKKPAAKPLRILLTNAHKPAGLGAMRSLGRAGHTIIAAFPQGSERPASIWSRYCSGTLDYPDPWRYQFEFRDWLHKQAHSGTIDAVLPISEACIIGVAAMRKDLPSDFLSILPSDASLEFTLSKFQATRMALSLGIPCPPTVFISDGTGTWDDDFSGLHFPMVIKTDNRLTTEGVYIKGRTFVATDGHAVAKILRDHKHGQTRIMAQDMIPGSGTGAFLLRFGATTRLRFAHRRLHEVPYTGGYSSFRESCRDEGLISLGEAMLDAIDYEGVAMVEFRRGAIDGKPYFLEINGRLWGSLALALHAGVDFPVALIECYQNGRPGHESSRYRAGIQCRNIFPGELNHLLSILGAKNHSGGASPPSKFRAVLKFIALSFNPTIRHDYFWWTDPLPGINQALGITTLFLTKSTKKVTEKIQRRRENCMLQRLQTEHQTRCRQPKYFRQSLHRIMFLCYGNICRSPFAVHYWNARIREFSLLRPKAISAGFHPHAYRKTPVWIAHLATEHGVDLTIHRSRALTRSEVESSDAIFIMDRKNYRDLIAQFRWAKHKTYFLGLFADDGRIEIDDPYNMNEDNARLCYQQLVLSLDGLMKRIVGG